MSKVAVVYWTGSGNTEAMAAAVAKGAEAKGATVEQILAADFSLSAAEEYDAYAFGCPAMGAEELEDSEFRPMWDEVKGSLGDKKVVLFGSYGWGSGEWSGCLEGRCRRDRRQRHRLPHHQRTAR